MRRINFDDLDRNGLAGDWCFSLNSTGMLLKYPYRDADGNLKTDVVHLPLTRQANVSRQWEWNGDREAPTLSPSIHVIGRWHGFLTDGKLISV